MNMLSHQKKNRNDICGSGKNRILAKGFVSFVCANHIVICEIFYRFHSHGINPNHLFNLTLNVNVNRIESISMEIH